MSELVSIDTSAEIDTFRFVSKYLYRQHLKFYMVAHDLE